MLQVRQSSPHRWTDDCPEQSFRMILSKHIIITRESVSTILFYRTLFWICLTLCGACFFFFFCRLVNCFSEMLFFITNHVTDLLQLFSFPTFCYLHPNYVRYVAAITSNDNTRVSRFHEKAKCLFKCDMFSIIWACEISKSLQSVFTLFTFNQAFGEFSLEISANHSETIIQLMQEFWQVYFRRTTGS